MGRLVTVYEDVKDDLPLFLHLFKSIKKERLNRPQIIEVLKTPNRLLDLGKQADLYNNHIWTLHEQKPTLEKEIGMLSESFKKN